MLEVLTIGSYESELKPQIDNQWDTDFLKERQISFESLETTECEFEEIEAQIEIALRLKENSKRICDYIERACRAIHYRDTLESFSTITSSVLPEYTLSSALGVLCVSALVYTPKLGIDKAILDFSTCATGWDLPKLKRDKEIFGISTPGIAVMGDGVKIDPNELEQDVFHLFSYQNEKYVARKTVENVVEIYEVQE